MIPIQPQQNAKENRSSGLAGDTFRPELTAAGGKEADIRSALGGSIVPTTRAAAPLHRKRRLWILLPVVLLLGGGTAAAYLAFFATSPDQILNEALYRAVWADTSEYTGSLHVKVAPDPESEELAKASQTFALIGASGDLSKPTELFLNFEASNDRSDPKDMKSSVAYDLAVVDNAGKNPVGGLQTRHVGGITYLSLTRAPQVPFFDLSPLVGTWMAFDPKGLAGMLGLPAAEAEQIEGAAIGKPTPQQREAISQAFAELRPITVTEGLKDEPVAGAASRHYRLAVDKEKLRAFMLRLQDIMKDDPYTYGRIIEDFDKFSDEVAVSTLEIWIGRESGLPTRLLLSLDVSSSKDVPGKGEVELDMTFKSFNQPVTISEPAEVRSLEEIIGQLMGDYLATEGNMTGIMGVEDRGATATMPN